MIWWVLFVLKNSDSYPSDGKAQCPAGKYCWKAPPLYPQSAARCQPRHFQYTAFLHRRYAATGQCRSHRPVPDSTAWCTGIKKEHLSDFSKKCSKVLCKPQFVFLLTFITLHNESWFSMDLLSNWCQIEGDTAILTYFAFCVWRINEIFSINYWSIGFIVGIWPDCFM